jgi:hypothetical protein
MADADPRMKPIWYFVGLILLVMGGIIFLAGLYGLLVRPLGPPKVLGSLHPDIWWGGFMVLAGAFFFLAGRKSKAGRAD